MRVLFPQVVQKHKLGAVRKYILVAYLLSNACATVYMLMHVHVINVCLVSVDFELDSRLEICVELKLQHGVCVSLC